MSFAPRRSDILVVTDVQNDFCPGGALPVEEGHDVVPVINRMARLFPHAILTQDWHPAAHISFASTHGRPAFSTIHLPYGTQVLWPDHCVQGTKGAELHPELDVPHAQAVIRKGYHPAVDSYSAFREADRETPTGLAGYLREREIRRVFVCGLATDFCVAWTAHDARAAGFEVVLIDDASRGIDLDGSLERAYDKMQADGIQRISSAALA